MAASNQEILNYLGSSPNLSDADIYSFMQQKGVSPQQIASVTGLSINNIIARLAPLIAPNQSILLGDTYVQSIYDVIGSGEDQQLGSLKNIITYKAGGNKSGNFYNQYTPTGELERTGTEQTIAPQNVLGGVILAGDSWLSGAEKTALANTAFGKPVANTAIGAQKTSDVLNQLNQFEENGGTFASGSTVVLNIGGNDLATGVDKKTITKNINEIVSRLDGYGVNVILSGAPSANSYSEAISSTNLVMDNLYNDVAKTNKNVVVVDAMSGLLNQKNLMDESGFHLKDDASKLQFIDQLASAYKGEAPPLIAQAVSTSPVAQANVPTNTVTDYQGKTYDKTTLLNLAKELAPSIDANRLKGGVYSTTGQSIGFNYDEATSALGYAPSAAEQVVLDMARHLMDEGVTSADQIQATDTNRRFGSTYSGEGGTVYEIKRDENGNLVTSTWGRTTSDKGNIIAAATIAAAFMGVPADIGTAVLSQGASSAAINTVGGAIFGAGTAALSGGDIVKGALLGGAGGALGDYLNTASGAVLGDASDIAMTMADAGSSLSEIENALTNRGFSANVVADSLKDAANVLAPKAINIPSTVSGLTDAVNVVGQSVAPSLNNVLSTIASTAPVAFSTPVTDGGTVKVTGATEPKMTTQQVIDLVNSQIAANVTAPTNLATQTITAPKSVSTQDVINAIAATIPAVTAVPTEVSTPTIPTKTVIAEKPSSITDVITAATIPLIQPTTPLEVPKVTAEKEMSDAEKIRLAQLGLTAAGLLTAGSALSNTGTPTGFPIVPIPADWKTPPATGVAPFTPLPSINFGDRNLLIGTQWEKFLDPNYGKVPEPIKYSQPSNMSYNDLMGILGSKQGMPSASSLSINDIISGIQNQYGQTPTRTMG
jgi:hypothetical protein